MRPVMTRWDPPLGPVATRRDKYQINIEPFNDIETFNDIDHFN